MNNVINTLLLVHKIGNEKIDLPFYRVNMRDVLSRAVVLQKRYADKKNIEIEVNNIENIFVWGDRLALQEAISNIIKNSIIHTSENGRVELTMRLKNNSGTMLEILIKDNGKGISSKDMPYIFDPFYRGMGPYRDPKPDIYGQYSFGLGLSIAKEIVERYDGIILADSKIGIGTTFTIHLPVAF
jgi:two-component system phosphate regulon sensor histidine kinase PhoR